MQPTIEFYSKVQNRSGSVLILIPAEVYRDAANLNIGETVKVTLEVKPRGRTHLEETRYGVAANATLTGVVSDAQKGKSLQPAPQGITQYGILTSSTRKTPTSTNAEIEKHEDIYLQQVVMF